MTMGIPAWMMPDWKEAERELRERQAAAEKRYFDQILAPSAIDWDPGFGKKGLNKLKKVCFKASSYTSMQKPLFPEVKPVVLTQKNLKEIHPNDVRGPALTYRGEKAVWVYRNAILPRGKGLWMVFGNAKGECFFDDDIVIPQLCHYRKMHWTRPFLVWMSNTPMEMITQRAGVKHCSGHVCIGGHGMGWFLEQVAAKRSVKSIVVVEKSMELLDWFARDQVKRIAKETGTPIDIVCEDVFPYLERFHSEFDKIALDVFKAYGNNNAEDDVRIKDLLRITPDLGRPWEWKYRFDQKKLWCWGSVKIGQRERNRRI